MVRDAAERQKAAQTALASRFAGESGRRQPVHTVYGGAHLFKSDSAAKLGGLALRTLDEYAPDAASFAAAIGIDAKLAEKVYPRVVAKLKKEPVEDFRIDFEDGYGVRPDEEEDRHVLQAADETAKGLAAGTLPPFLGIRIKTFSAELGSRAVRTLDLFLGALIEKSGGKLPSNFVVTLPKVTSPEHVALLADLFDALEPKLGLSRGALKMEMMVETTQSILGPDGRCALPSFLDAAKGRCTGAHFGTYDYTASCGITAAHQAMGHPACDFAKAFMQVAFAGTGVWISDGATTVMPVPVHRAKEGASLTSEQRADNRRAVHAALKLHADDVRHSLVTGFYQGWDLHPGQLSSRYGTVYAFFLSGLAQATERLKNFVEKAAQATLVGDIFDDAATGQGLLNYFLRGLNCGALTEEEALATGLTLDELRSKSFVKVLENRRKR